MKRPELYLQKILTGEQARQQVQSWHLLGQTVVFTNGVFDLLHQGHLYSLGEAAKEGDRLIVAINSDASVKRLKGPDRPIQSETTRSHVLAALLFVDAVVIFDEDTPANLIEQIEPDVLVKGGDYRPDQIAGAESVIQKGGRIVINPILEGFSTTSQIQKMIRR
ncbi:MAG: D-glycero-beta-D-manno-heptose 1-phosphate adenylyltransferase [Bacteroidota bacterium]